MYSDPSFFKFGAMIARGKMGITCPLKVTQQDYKQTNPQSPADRSLLLTDKGVSVLIYTHMNTQSSSLLIKMSVSLPAHFDGK